MKTISAIALLLMMQISFGQEKRDPGEFTSLKVFDRISVELIPADANVVEISGTRSKEVEIVNKNGDLHIRMPLKKLLQGEEIQAKVYYRDLQKIEVGEGSFLSGAQVMKQEYLSLDAREGSEIRLMVEVGKLNVRSVTGATARLSGSAKFMEASLGTGGSLKAKELATAHTSISITTGGQAGIFATDLVEAKIKAGGDITVYGNPRKIEEKITLGGSVTRVSE